MKKILIIGAGWEQVPLINKAKEMGLYVIATNTDESGEGLALADAKESVNPRDLSKVVAIAEKYHIDAVTADECDYSYFASVFVANYLGLPATKIDIAQTVSSKKRMRMQCRDHGVIQPKFFACATLKATEEAVEMLGFPVIIKPCDNRGNFGVNLITDQSQVARGFFEALANSHSREILVEEFIEGTMVMVDGYVFNDKGHVPLAIASKKMLGGNKRVAMDIIYPAQIPMADIERIIKINDTIANDVFEFDRGAVHSEFIVDKNNIPYFIETHNRGGGVYISSKIVPSLTNVDVSECLIRQALGESVNLPVASNLFAKCALLKFFKFPSGKIKQLLNLEEAKKTPGLLVARVSVKEGDLIKEITNDANRHGFTITVGDSVEDVYKDHEQTLNAIKIIYDYDK